MADGYGFLAGYAVVSTNYPLDGDFATIQEAILAGACGIYVRAGEYQPGESITVPENVTIIGESKASVIDFQGGSWGFVLSGNNIVIDNLSVTGAMGASGAFLMNVCTNSMVTRCKATACTRVITFQGSTFCHLKECWGVGQSLEHVYIDSTSTDNRVIDNRLTDGLFYGIVLEGSFNKIRGNNVSGHANNDGILVKSGFNEIQGNTCNQNENGIYIAVDGGDHNTIDANICYANEGYGINVNSLENTGNVVGENICRTNGVADIRIVPGNLQNNNDANTIV